MTPMNGHPHTFGTDLAVPGEGRTRWVVAITIAMMVIEIAAGSIYGSMALLADGWHMGTHAAALGVTLFAYVYARRHASNPRFSFGTGKVGALGGFASAVGLAVVAILVLLESAGRFVQPVTIRFDEAIGVAVGGLAVNLGCAWLLKDHEHDRDDHGDEVQGHAHRDHNLRAAYLHVLADALTSIFAIAALVTGKLFGWLWMDPVMGIVGSVVIARWSVGLIRDTSAVLLDAEAPADRREEIRRAVEGSDASMVTDLHLWRVGPRHLAAVVSITTTDDCSPADYKERLAGHADLAHVTVEVNVTRQEAGR